MHKNILYAMGVCFSSWSYTISRKTFFRLSNLGPEIAEFSAEIRALQACPFIILDHG